MNAKAPNGADVVTVCCLSPNRWIVGVRGKYNDDGRQRSIMLFSWFNGSCFVAENGGDGKNWLMQSMGKMLE
jgi:hypothetical protein